MRHAPSLLELRGLRPPCPDLRLNEVLFFDDLPVALGVGKNYCQDLIRPCNEKLRRLAFPQPIYQTPSGIRVWSLSEVTDWCLDLRRRKHPQFGVSVFTAGWPLIEYPGTAQLWD